MCKILTHTNGKYCAVGILFDMSKAYDRASHAILHNRLHGVGMRDDALECIKSGELRNLLSEVVTRERYRQYPIFSLMISLKVQTHYLCVKFADDVS